MSEADAATFALISLAGALRASGEALSAFIECILAAIPEQKTDNSVYYRYIDVEGSRVRSCIFYKSGLALEIVTDYSLVLPEIRERKFLWVLSRDNDPIEWNPDD